MPLNFPSSPTDGQIYETYQWDATKGVWVSGRYSDYRPASTDIAGIVELATDAETQAGSDAAKAITPASLATLTATSTRRGLAEFATSAEAIAKSSATLAITPSALGAVLALPGQGQVPSSVQLGSGSSSIEADGTVVFTGASRVSLNGVFDGLGSDVYEFEGYCTGTAVGAIYTRMRQSGVDRSTAVYNFVGNYTVNAAGPTRLSNFGQVYFGLWWINYTANVPNAYVRGTFFRPAQSSQTQILLQSGVSASDRILWHEYGDATSAVEDGFSIIASSGTMSGRIKVRKVA